ncbi:MAG: cellulose binding domain-containing protein, partial [Cyclobacteriaceae bacterium]
QLKELGEVPKKPTNLTASVSSPWTIDLHWTDNSNDELGFIIERAIDSGEFMVIDTVSAGVTQYVDSVSNSSAINSYRIAAYKVGGKSLYSDVAGLLVPYLYPTLRDADQDLDNNQIKPHLQIWNVSNDTINLEDVTMRYWFISEGHNSLNGYIDWAEVGKVSLNLSFTKTTFALDGANWYMEVSFDSNVELLPNSSLGQMMLRIAKLDWTDFDESNDYSYNGASEYQITQKVTIYNDNNLIWGKEPEASIIQEPMIKVVYKNGDKHLANNQIKPHFKLVNEGNQDVLYEDIKVRYYFTEEWPGATYALNVDYAVMGSGLIDGEFGGHKYVEYSFGGSGVLHAYSNSGKIQTRINATNWSRFDESNDYSLIDTDFFFDNNHMTVYIQDSLHYGIEPDTIGSGGARKAGELADLEKVLEQETQLDLKAYPIPVTDVLNLDFISGSPVGQVLVEVIDLAGRVHISQSVQATSNNLQIDMPVSRGIYILRVQLPESKSIWNMRIIKN